MCHSFAIFLLCFGLSSPYIEASSIRRNVDPKHTFNQFQINVLGEQNAQPPGPAPPGYIWVQIPVTTQPPTSQQPSIYQPTATLPTVTPQTSIATSLKCPKPRGQFPSIACNKYLNCWDGVAVEQVCPDGLVFSTKGYCDYPANVDCGRRPLEGVPAPSLEPGLSSAPTTPLSELADVTPSDPSLAKKCLRPRGQFPSDSCRKFVNCWDGVIVEQECPEGLLFSARQGYCDYPSNVVCQDNSPPTSTKRISGRCLADFGTFREAGDCSRYYTCIGGQRVAEYECSPGFKFNDNIGVCDYEDRVDCSKEPLVFSPLKKYLDNIPKNFLSGVDDCTPGSVVRLNPQCTAACLCRTGLTEIVQCPAGLAYDSKADKCLLPQFAKC